MSALIAQVELNCRGLLDLSTSNIVGIDPFSNRECFVCALQSEINKKVKIL